MRGLVAARTRTPTPRPKTAAIGALVVLFGLGCSLDVNKSNSRAAKTQVTIHTFECPMGVEAVVDLHWGSMNGTCAQSGIARTVVIVEDAFMNPCPNPGCILMPPMCEDELLIEELCPDVPHIVEVQGFDAQNALRFAGSRPFTPPSPGNTTALGTLANPYHCTVPAL